MSTALGADEIYIGGAKKRSNYFLSDRETSILSPRCTPPCRTTIDGDRARAQVLLLVDAKRDALRTIKHGWNQRVQNIRGPVAASRVPLLGLGRKLADTRQRQKSARRHQEQPDGSA